MSYGIILSMIEELILGVVQGITEWLPLSSSGMLLLIETNFFADIHGTFVEKLQFIAFLHLGTSFAILIYFKKDVWNLIKTFFSYKKSTLENQIVLKFFIITTIVTGIIGLILKELLEYIENIIAISSPLLNIIIGMLLIITGILSFKKETAKKSRGLGELTIFDSIITGLSQGLSAIPGISRSGVTIAVLLFRNIEKTTALHLSFIVALPIVLGANILLETEYLLFSTVNLAACFLSFVFGILTIHTLLRFAELVNIGYFVIIFGILLVLASFLPLG